jgi:hypothetical protein
MATRLNENRMSFTSSFVEFAGCRAGVKARFDELDRRRCELPSGRHLQ